MRTIVNKKAVINTNFAKGNVPKGLRSIARRMWRASFMDKQLWRNARHAGDAFSFRVWSGRCAA